VNLDYYPDTRPLLAGHPDVAFEIPTIRSDIENLKGQLRNLDLPGISLKIQKALAAMQHVLEEIEEKIEPLAGGLHGTMESTKASVRSMQR
jgi:hypothetical protein